MWLRGVYFREKICPQPRHITHIPIVVFATATVLIYICTQKGNHTSISPPCTHVNSAPRNTLSTWKTHLAIHPSWQVGYNPSYKQGEWGSSSTNGVNSSTKWGDLISAKAKTDLLIFKCFLPWYKPTSLKSHEINFYIIYPIQNALKSQFIPLKILIQALVYIGSPRRSPWLLSFLLVYTLFSS